MSVAGYIDPTKPETFRPMDALIRGITIDYQNHGEKFGRCDKRRSWKSNVYR